MELYEFSIKRHLSFNAVKSALSKAFDIRQDNVGTSLDFYEYPEAIQLGFDMENQHAGFETLVECCTKQSLTPKTMLNIAVALSKHASSDVAIGDITLTSDISTDEFLVITADGFIYQACEDMSTFETDSIFDLLVYSKKMLITDFMKKL